MLSVLPDPDTLYAALLARDPAFDGHAFVGVVTTGVFCRLTCPARKPLRRNTRFFDTVSACLEAGFRPCRRCRPLDRIRAREPLVDALMTRLDEAPDRLWREADLAVMGLDPSTVRRAFKRHVGMTFLDLARLRRTGLGIDRLTEGASVIEAQMEAGYDSGSGFREAVARLVEDNPAKLRGRDLLKADWIETPLGVMLAVADRHALHLLEFLDRKALPGELLRLRRGTRSAIGFGRAAPIDAVEAELALYFAGEADPFRVALAAEGTPFTREVWQALRAIPAGRTRSYREVASAIGRPEAVRAVARANGANPIAILVPCHRVIGVDGALTGYGGGLWRKRWLIEHERRIAGRAGTTATPFSATAQGPSRCVPSAIMYTRLRDIAMQ